MTKSAGGSSRKARSACPGPGGFVATLGLVVASLLAVPAFAELPVEDIGAVESLPADYPDHWVFAHDTNFASLSDGKVVLVDVAAETREIKGSVPAAQFASFIESPTRPELYVAETLYTRRIRGTRIDLITIHDKTTLRPVAEIELPGGKRGQYVTLKNTLQLLNDGNWLLVFNFTPAQSVAVIDLESRKPLSEIAIAGCSLVYPLAKRSFASLCANDTMLVTHLDAQGKVAKQSHTKVFFDANADPLFEKPVRIDGIDYFPSFLGDVQPVDMSGEEPVFGRRWPLVSDTERKAGWRPGGWQIASADAAGRLYVLMHEKGYNGSHKDGGAEVWVFDAASGKRLARHVLKHWGISIEATSGDDPLLVVTNSDMALDVYGAVDGKHLRQIGGGGAQMPMVLHAAK